MSPFLGTRGAGSNRAFGYAGAAAPAQVTGLTATDFGTSRAYNNGRIDLSWTAPANNGATISGYLIERSTDGSTYSTLVANTGSSATTYSDTSLLSAQIYYYKVSAINAAGTGLASTAANATATTVPQAPTIGTAADGGTGTTVTVTYTANATGGKAVSVYTATSSPGSITGTGSSPITVSGLTTGTAYTFTVTATNANGTSTPSAASNSVTPQTYWASSLQSSASSYGEFSATATDSSSNIISGGSNYISSTYGQDSILQKYNNSGTVQWTKLFRGENTNNPDKINDVKIDSSSNIYTGGYIRNPGSVGSLIKFNSAGTLQWQKKIYSDKATTSDEIYGIAVDSSGNTYAVGSLEPSAGGRYGFVLKTNSSGTIQWIRNIGSLAPDVNTGLYGVGVDSSGNVYVSGNTQNIDYQDNGFIAKYNSSGTVQWQKRFYNSSGSQNVRMRELQTDSSGNVYITGRIGNSNGGKEIYLAKLDTNGNVSWQRRLQGTQSINNRNDEGYGISYDSSGNVYVAGTHYRSDNVNVGIMAKYNSSGTIQWQREVRGELSTYPGYIYKNSTLSDGTPVFAGFTRRASGENTQFTIKYIPDGSKTGLYTVPNVTNFKINIASGTMTDAAGSATFENVTLDRSSVSYTFTDSSIVQQTVTPTTGTVNL